MSSPIEKRVAALESQPQARRELTSDELEKALIERAARCGFTEAQVIATFGGWPRFAYACMLGEVVDPAEPVTTVAAPAEMSPREAYMRMIGRA